MISPVHPALIFILGALILPLVPGRRAKQVLLLLVPLAALADLLIMPYGAYWSYKFLSYQLVFARVDKLSLCFGYAFAIVAFLSAIYALHIRQYGQHSATFLSVGSTFGDRLCRRCLHALRFLGTSCGLIGLRCLVWKE